MSILQKLLLIVGLIASFNCETNTKQIKMYHETLNNGLKVIIIPIKSNGSVRFGIVYNVGCADDQNCKVGLSHFLEHMMFKGTKTISGEQLKYLIDKYNSYTNACTDDDYTMYYHTCNKEFLTIDIKLEADRMENLALNDTDVKNEQNVIMEERHWRCDVNPEARYVYDAVPRLLYLYSNYAYNGIGYPHHIKAYTKYALQKHYNEYYTPNNATVVIIGDVDKDKVMTMIKDTFGKIRKRHDVSRNRVLDPDDLDITYTMDRVSDKITKKQLSIVYKIPRKNINTLKKYYIEKIAVDCLCGTPRSLMFKKFIEEENLFYNIEGSITIKRFDKAFVFINATVPDSLSLKEAEQTILSYIKHVNSSDILTKEMFEANKKRILNQILIMNDNPGAMFGYFVDTLVNGYDPNDIKNIYEIVSGITWDEFINEAKNSWNEKSKTLTIYNHPKGSL